MNTKKPPPQDDTPVKILKLYNIFNKSIEAANFPKELKYADVTPVYKKITDTKKRIIGLLI